MVPRQPLLPNKGAALSILGSKHAATSKKKSKEEPSIATWATPGRGPNGEHSTGVASSQEMWRTLLLGRQWGAK